MGINILMKVRRHKRYTPPCSSSSFSLFISFLPFPFSHHKNWRSRQSTQQMFRFLIITNVNIYVTFKVFDLYSSLRTMVALLQKSQWSGDFWGRALSQSCSQVSALCNTPSILLHSDHYHAITQNSPVSSSPGATLKPVPRPLPSCAPPLPSPLGSTALE